MASIETMVEYRKMLTAQCLRILGLRGNAF